MESPQQFFQHANSCHPDIVFTYVHGRSVPFLDVQATIRNDSIVMDLYTKPTNTHQYLLPASNHPPHVHNNLPYGLGLRLRAIVSEPETLELRLNELTEFLVRGGYSLTAVSSQLDRVRGQSRRSLLESSRRTHLSDEGKRVPLVCTWNPLLPPLQDLLKGAFPVLQYNERAREIFRLPMVAYKRPSNLRDLLVHTRPRCNAPREAANQNFLSQSGTFACGSTRCKTCAMVKQLKEVPGDNEEVRHIIQGHFTCKSMNIVYLLTCTTCRAAYVGETGCALRDRMNHHRCDMKNNEDTPVAQHFKGNHSARDSVLVSTPEDTVQRRVMERAWIKRLSRQSSPWQLINRDTGIDVLTLDP